eukprot:6284421-Amphidinium_carterae.1
MGTGSRVGLFQGLMVLRSAPRPTSRGSGGGEKPHSKDQDSTSRDSKLKALFFRGLLSKGRE